MKTLLLSFARALPIVAALAASAALVSQPAIAAHGGGGGGGGGGGWHGGGGSHGGGGAWHGGAWHGHYYGGYRGYYGPGYYWPAFWGGVGIGIGVGYYGGYYGYYPGYYAPYYNSYYYGDPMLVAPASGTTDQGTGRTGQPVPQATTPPEPIFYPRNGQSAETTESDRRECNRWATTQRGAMDDASIFQRATFACMEGRGYTVR